MPAFSLCIFVPSLGQLSTFIVRHSMPFVSLRLLFRLYMPLFPFSLAPESHSGSCSMSISPNALQVLKICSEKSENSQISHNSHAFFCMTILTILAKFAASLPTLPSLPCYFLHGDIDVFGDIANIATFASAFFHHFIDHFEPFFLPLFTSIYLPTTVFSLVIS